MQCTRLGQHSKIRRLIISTPFSVFGEDMSCDFESELWYKGHCNWIYSSSSKDQFEWITDDDEANSFIEMKGNQKVVLESLGAFTCHANNDIKMTFKLKMQGSKVKIGLEYETGYYNTLGIMSLLIMELDEDTVWKEFTIDICRKAKTAEDQSFKIIMEFTSFDEGSIGLDTIKRIPVQHEHPGSRGKHFLSFQILMKTRNVFYQDVQWFLKLCQPQC